MIDIIKKDAEIKIYCVLKKIPLKLNYFAIFFIKSTTLHEYPHSLSYHPTTLTMFPSTIVESESKIFECELPTISARNNRIFCIF